MLEKCWKKISSRSFSPKSASLLSLLLAFSVPFPAQNALAAMELVPFVLPWNDTSKTVVSVAGLNSPIATERVRVSPSGHLVLSAAPQTSDTDPQIRFIGMNMTFEAGLPPREMAPQVAGRLAKFGVNAVRFHHVDNDWCDALLDYSKGDSRHVNAERLDDFHYFISQLKTNGIYVDMNLLVSRMFKVNDGFPEDLNALGWKTQHILGFFNDHALELQKEYASQILCAKNPYTGLSMAQDPVVAFVEILNENGILQKWKEGDLDQMPPVFQTQLRTRWNEWLNKRYTSAEELRQKWGAQEIPLGPNLLKNADFSESSTKEGSLNIHPWMLENHSGKAELALDEGHTNGVKALKIKVTQPADLAWHIQLKQSQMNQKAGQLKTISFWAKADKNLKLELNASQEGKTYSNVGLSQSLSLNADEWRYFSFTYVASSTEDNFRPVWGGFANQECTVWISDVRLMDGGTLGNLPKNASLKEGNIPNINFRSGNP
ncbi:MAG TPA: carbohydrate binding domain-containing protein, partial [Verrucomicrobiota bacterium]|nr:carbohydrate binding domain-containing protein [Verrucomicrobiota bacterium]